MLASKTSTLPITSGVAQLKMGRMAENEWACFVNGRHAYCYSTIGEM